MKDTLLYEILLIWNKLSKKEKLKYLQKFEAMNALLEHREEREIVLKDLQGSGQNVLGEFSTYCPEIIKLDQSFDNKSAIENISTIHHEGFHALVDDFFKEKSDLRTFSTINGSKLKEEYSFKHLIYNRARYENLLTLFSLNFYEEQIVHVETCLYLISQLLQTCETLQDCQKLFGVYYYKILGSLYNFTNYRDLVDKTSPLSYKNILELVKRIDIKLYSDKVLNANTSKKIISKIDPKSLEHFERNYKLFLQLQNQAISTNTQHQLVRKMTENLHEDCLSK